MSNYDSDNIYVGNGAADVIFKILSVLDINSVTFSTPCFDGFKYMIQALNLSENSISLFDDGNQNFNGLINSNLFDIVILCNPHNPTGELLSLSKLDELLRCFPKNKYIILDEVYIDYTKNNVDSLSLLEKYNNLIIVRSFSKSFGLAGLRIGYCISNKKIINALKNKTVPYNINSISSVAACSALNNICKI
ncbi:aminotransferase class I/II-fold pyridoxal phosphate-dependent enzyme [Xenorhabdus nematophila]|uniref:aminotransferase class I/II-fold pyridoxal phosphate-dependent enzyme n=1 Tax=Xenorhabdus nematophila TaxID=628 RepID=UPI0009DB299E|nr:aminotransferase class I/II-fold pyridoxal phosphate-dependent enzyme [Xenorhabdus nematophila]